MLCFKGLSPLISGPYYTSRGDNSKKKTAHPEAKPLKQDHTHHISELVNAHPVGLVPHRRLLVVFVNNCQVVLPYVTPGMMKGYQAVSLFSLVWNAYFTYYIPSSNPFEKVRRIANIVIVTTDAVALLWL